MHASDHDDLKWLAFRYVAGELAADESDAFEQRLADDQLARNAVANAVQLAECVSAAEAPLPVRAKQAISMPTGQAIAAGRRSRFVAIMAALCAMLLIGVFMRAWNAGVDPFFGSGMPHQLTGDASLQERLDLLAIWNEWNDDQSFGDESVVAENPFDRSTGTDNVAGAAAADAVESTEQEFEVPGWMIAALSPEPVSGPEDSGAVPVEN